MVIGARPVQHTDHDKTFWGVRSCNVSFLRHNRCVGCGLCQTREYDGGVVRVSIFGRFFWLMLQPEKKIVLEENRQVANRKIRPKIKRRTTPPPKARDRQGAQPTHLLDVPMLRTQKGTSCWGCIGILLFSQPTDAYKLSTPRGLRWAPHRRRTTRTAHKKWFCLVLLWLQSFESDK